MNLGKLITNLQFSMLRLKLGWLLIPFLALRELSKGMKRTQYAQFREDLELSQICPDVGFYIDIGSGRPISGSNTYLLYKNGWSGWLIDPLSINLILSRLLRRRDKTINACIGSAGRINFYQLFPYEYSTTSRDEAEKLISSRRARLIKKRRVNVIEPGKILKLPIEKCFLLCIDAEGMDYQILAEFPFEIYKPDVICVENRDNKTPDKKGIHSLLLGEGYNFHKRLGLSEIYLLRSSKYLLL